MKKDYYNILGVDKNATEEAIKSAYRDCAKKWHPDRFVNKSEEERKAAEEKFKEISEAYSVLSDPDKRKMFDTYGTVEGNPFEGFRSTGMGDLDDILAGFRNMYTGGFGDFGMGFNPFGGMGRRNSTHTVIKPKVLEVHVRITVKEIYEGVTKHLSYKYYGKCTKCSGSGVTDGGKIEDCPYCGGKGQIVNTIQNGWMSRTEIGICPHCGGTGKAVSNPCPNCNGSGLEVCTDEIDVKIPTGVVSGSYVIFPDKGNCAERNPSVRGDIAIVFDVVPDEKYTINGQFDIVTSIEIPILDCITGCEPTIEAIDGKKYTTKLSPGVEHGKNIRMRGMGLLKPDGTRGDMYVKVVQKFPFSLSKTDLKTIEQLKKSKSFS